MPDSDPPQAIVSAAPQQPRTHYEPQGTGPGRKLVYTAHSKHWFFCRDAVCEYVLTNEALPLNPFRVFGYFLADRVERDLIRAANRQLLLTCDEIWTFGAELADGVLEEIDLAERNRMPVRHFTIASWAQDITLVTPQQLTVEPEVLARSGLPEQQVLTQIRHGPVSGVTATWRSPLQPNRA